LLSIVVVSHMLPCVILLYLYVFIDYGLVFDIVCRNVSDTPIHTNRAVWSICRPD